MQPDASKGGLTLLDVGYSWYADASISTDPVWPWVFQFDTTTIARYRAIAPRWTR